MRIVIVGASFAGIHTALQIRRKDPQAEILLIEKDEVGFIPGSVSLLLQEKATSLTEVNWIDAKQLEENDIRLICGFCTGMTGEQEIKLADGQTITFDKLVIATGSGQSSRYIKEKPTQVYSIKSRKDADELLKALPQLQKIAIIGAGQVGLELAEGLVLKQKEVHLFESQPSILYRYLDEEMSLPVVETMQKRGVHLHLNTMITGITEEKNVILRQADGGAHEFDALILANSTRPDNHIWQDTLRLNDDDTVWVDEHLETSVKDVYAVGDAIQVSFKPTGEKMYVSLVNNAMRTAEIVAENILGNTIKDEGTLRTIGNQIFGYYIGSTGLTETEGIFYPGSFYTVVVEAPLTAIRPSVKLKAKLLFDQDTDQIIGAQLLSQGSVFDWLNGCSQAITGKLTRAQLSTQEFFFHPEFRFPETIFTKLGEQL